MKVTPLDIRRKEFRRSVRGYLDEDVDIFLDVVADEVERISRQNAELLQKVRELEQQVASHVDIREALEQTLVAAQLQSEEMKTKAEKESQSMLKEAEAKAKAVVEDFYARTQAVQQTLAQLKLQEEDFRSRFKGLLEGYLNLLKQQPPVVSVPAAAAQGGAAHDSGTETPQSPTAPKTPGAEKAGEGKGADAPVYFGRRDEDADDPFPEIGGDSATPREFAW